MVVPRAPCRCRADAGRHRLQVHVLLVIRGCCAPRTGSGSCDAHRPQRARHEHQVAIACSATVRRPCFLFASAAPADAGAFIAMPAPPELPFQRYVLSKFQSCQRPIHRGSPSPRATSRPSLICAYSSAQSRAVVIGLASQTDRGLSLQLLERGVVRLRERLAAIGRTRSLRPDRVNAFTRSVSSARLDSPSPAIGDPRR